jgi:hypothetical protein
MTFHWRRASRSVDDESSAVPNGMRSHRLLQVRTGKHVCAITVTFCGWLKLCTHKGIEDSAEDSASSKHETRNCATAASDAMVAALLPVDSDLEGSTLLTSATHGMFHLIVPWQAKDFHQRDCSSRNEAKDRLLSRPVTCLQHTKLKNRQKCSTDIMSPKCESSRYTTRCSCPQWRR